MKKIISLFSAGLLAASCAIAQTAPPAAPPVIGAPAATGATAPAAVPRPKNPQMVKDYQDMLAKLNITEPLRRGPGGSAANYDESKANPYPNLPDPLTFKNG